VAILNSPNSSTLWQDARSLLDYGFSRYGLASPPPVRPEPTLIMAQRTPDIFEAEPLTAVRYSSSASRQEAPVVSVKRKVRQTTTVVVAKPGSKLRLAPVVATKKPLLGNPVKMAARSSKPAPVKSVNVVARSGKAAPVNVVAKSSKSAQTVAAKVDARRTVTKVARAEPVSLLPRSKNAKRGG
jgi:hypothetical protein